LSPVPEAREWLLVFLSGAVSVLAYAQPVGATLPDLSQEKFEPAVEEQIRRAYDEARGNPRDANTIGKLGMIFQVYGKYELAESCYRRALGLAPSSFRWTYYLGNVEGWLGKSQDAIDHVREAVKI